MLDNECKEWPRDGAERVDVAAIDDPETETKVKVISIRDTFLKSIASRYYVTKENERKSRKDAGSRLLRQIYSIYICKGTAYCPVNRVIDLLSMQTSIL